MSVLDEIKKLDEQRAKLLSDAKKEALSAAQDAVKELNALGFNYRLVQAEGATTPTGTRRAGIRGNVLNTISKATDGISRASLLEALGVKGDKSGESSVSNALTALKKANKVTSDNGLYRAGG